MPKLELSKEDAEDILWGGNEKYVIVENKIMSTSRWSINYKLVFKDRNEEKYWMGLYSRGATECQMEDPWDYDDPIFHEVKPVEITIIDYELVKDETA